MRFLPRIAPRTDRCRSLAADERGATILEFALILLPLCTLLLGTLDFAHTLYVQAVLQGQLQRAARDSSLESASGADDAPRTAIDTKIENQIKSLNTSASVALTRRYYRTFSKAKAAQFEPFVDTNHDGRCNGPVGGTPAERFTDENGNGIWDADGGGAAADAGARDIMVYTVSVTYPSLFPVKSLFGGAATKTIVARTVLANQPYGDQADVTSTERDCL